MPTLSADLRTQASTSTIKLNGQELRPDELGQVVDITIDRDLLQPATFAVRLYDIDDQPSLGEQSLFGFLDADRFKIGDDIEIWLGREDERQLAMAGEITSVELEMHWDSEPIVVVRGYDRSYRMHRKRKSRTFNNMSDSALLQQLAGEHGLSARATATGLTYTVMVQDNQTDWEFLRARARRIGFELFVDGRALVMRPPSSDSGPPAQQMGKELQYVRMRMSAPRQVQTVRVRGWDPVRKAAVEASASTATSVRQIGELRTGGQLSTAAMGAGEYVLTNQPLLSPAEASKLAQASLDEIDGDYVQVEGTCLGDVRIQPGKRIPLEGIGRRFSGTYYVSAVTHRYTSSEGFMTRFTVNGRQPTSLTALLRNGESGGLNNQNSGFGYAGVVVGVVTDNKDPDMGGRVKVKFPWLADNVVSDWARIASPMAGNGRGFFWLPEVDDEVLVAFEQGDINHPYVVGGLWNGRDRPPSTAQVAVGADGKVNQRVIKSRSGHLITIDDTAGAEKVSIADKTGKLTLTFDSPTSKITVYATGDLTLEATQNVLVKGRAVTVQATNDLAMSGLNVSANARAQMTVKGATSEVEGTGTMKVKGATTDVEGSMLVNVKGGLIKLN